MDLPPAPGAELVDVVVQRTQPARVVITGTSMEPLLRAGMVVDIEPLATPARVGDILVFKSKNGLIAHRYVGGANFAFASHNIVLARRFRDPATGAFVTAGDAYPHRAALVYHEKPGEVQLSAIQGVEGSGLNRHNLEPADVYVRRRTFSVGIGKVRPKRRRPNRNAFQTPPFTRSAARSDVSVPR